MLHDSEERLDANDFRKKYKVVTSNLLRLKLTTGTNPTQQTDETS